jgi:hypothetical protein
VNLDGGRAGGVDLDSGRVVEAHVEEERGADMEARGGHGGGRTVVAHAEDVEEEPVPMDVW